MADWFVTMSRRALFLDRDGVINIDHGYVYLPEQTEWVPGIFELCRSAQGLGYDLIVITNQAGIARGYYDEAQFEAYTRWLHGQFANRGLPILATYHCPHHPTEGIGELRRQCDCRKPEPGMILRASRELDVDLATSAFVGDKPSDMAAGRAAGVGHCFQVFAHRADSGVATPSIDDAAKWLTSLSIK
jgi:D-glycero-D-manno-heptose 1,7-bisphosphate phosphatase